VETLKLFLMSVSVTQVPWLTMADCEIFDQRREAGVSVVQSPEWKKVISTSAWRIGLCKGPTVARCDVVDDRALVAVGPCVPLKLDRVSGVDVGVETAGRGTLVAVYICGASGCGLDETNVLVQRVPACGLGTTFFREVVPNRIRAVGENPLDVDSFDEAVGGYGVEKDGNGAEEKRGCVHDDADCRMKAVSLIALRLMWSVPFYLLLYVS
jgi:hypothetical protein